MRLAACLIVQQRDDGIRFMRLEVERHWNYNIWTAELGVIQNSR